MPLTLRVLLLEDDAERATRVCRLIEGAGGPGAVSCERVSTVAAASAVLRDRYIDLLVLDVCVPMRDGESPARDGGLRLLRALKLKNELRVPGYIVGLTGYGDLVRAYTDEFNQSMWMLVKYDGASDEWSTRLTGLIEHTLNARSSAASGYDADIAILTALYSIELESVLALDCGWRPLRVSGDEAIYHEGQFRTAHGALKVVATASLEMGMPAAAAVSMKMIHTFRPRYLVMTGIAAGVKGHFGDILVADQSWDYGSGKLTGKRRSSTVFSPAANVIPLSHSLQYLVHWFAARSPALAKIKDAWTDGAPRTPLRVHIGPVASGASVVAARRIVNAIQRRHRKVVGVEMETYGVFVATRMCGAPRPQALSIKSICDYGSATKDDRYQRYAAYTSARFLFDFACDSLAQEISVSKRNDAGAE